jgi:hypothetical protein
MRVKNGVAKSLVSFVIISILVIGVSVYFVFDEKLIGPAFLVLGLITMIFLKIFKIKLHSVYPDIVFGIVDNGVLVFAAVLGGVYAGVIGAIIGGAAGNTLTDGIGGLLEGYVAEKLRTKKLKEERTALSTMLGKIIGCLFGAGLGLIIVWLISLI